MWLIGQLVIGGIAFNLLWLGPLYYFSPGVRSLFKGGIKWRNPKTWAITAGIILGFSVIFYSLCACTALQATIRQPIPATPAAHTP